MNQDRSLQGIALCSLAYLFLALQDAVIKWLVADYSVFTICSGAVWWWSRPA